MTMSKESAKQETKEKEPEVKKQEAGSDKELSEKSKQIEELQKELETLKSTANPSATSITFDEVLKIDQLAD